MSRYCNICRNTSCLNHGTDTTLVGDDWGCNYIPAPTNADHIRAMSDEELSEFIAVPCQCTDYGCDGYRECGNESCLKHLLNWLQQPYKED